MDIISEKDKILEYFNKDLKNVMGYNDEFENISLVLTSKRDSQLIASLNNKLVDKIETTLSVAFPYNYDIKIVVLDEKEFMIKLINRYPISIKIHEDVHKLCDLNDNCIIMKDVLSKQSEKIYAKYIKELLDIGLNDSFLKSLAIWKNYVYYEYIEGNSLNYNLRNKLLSLKMLNMILYQITEAIIDLQKYDIQHLDLHAGNIIISTNYKPRIIDYDDMKIGKIKDQGISMEMLFDSIYTFGGILTAATEEKYEKDMRIIDIEKEPEHYRSFVTKEYPEYSKYFEKLYKYFGTKNIDDYPNRKHFFDLIKLREYFMSYTKF